MTDVTKIIQEDTKEDDTMMSVVKPTELKNTVVVGDKHIENDLISVTFDETKE